MPYMIVKKDDEYCVYKKDENGEPEGETLGCHDTKEKAQAQIAAIWANEHGKSVWITAEQMQEICPDCADKMRKRGMKAVNIASLKQMPEPLLQGLCEKFGDDPGFFTRCTESSFAGMIDDIDSFCAWLHYECLGVWPGEKSAESGEAPDTPPVREGRVLSEKNRQLIQEAIRQTKEAIQALQDLLDSTALPAEERRAVVSELAAVRMLTPTRIGGYAMVWGGRDLYGTYFTPETDAWRKKYPTPPLLYDHGFNEAIGAEALGRVVVRRIDNVGEWVEAELEKHEEYLAAIRPLLERGVLGFSTGAAAHLVDVDEDGRIRRWPVVEISLTPTPAEPRTLGVHELRALRIELPESDRESDGETAPSGESEADNVRAAQDAPNDNDSLIESEMEVTEMETENVVQNETAEVRGAYSAPAVIKTGLGDNATKAFLHWARTGDVGAVKTAVVWDEATATEGGVLVPEDYYNQIMLKATEQSIPRKMGCMIVRTSRDVVNIPLEGDRFDKFALTAEVSGTYNEAENTPFAAGAVTVYKFTRMLKISEELLADSAFNIEQYLADRLTAAVAATENYYAINGMGSNQPQGVLAGGSLGVTFAGATDVTAAKIVELYYSLPSIYRNLPSVAWTMADSTEYAIRKQQATSTAGEFLFQVTPAGVIDPNVLLGKPVFCTSAMPTIQASAKSVVLGDWSRFILVERTGLTISRNPYLYQANGLVAFFANIRFGMKVAQAEAFVYGQHPTS